MKPEATDENHYGRRAGSKPAPEAEEDHLRRCNMLARKCGGDVPRVGASMRIFFRGCVAVVVGMFMRMTMLVRMMMFMRMAMLVRVRMLCTIESP